MKSDQKEYLSNLRHSCAHLLAKAVLELYSGTHNATGPAIENGFYQDFDFGDLKISETNLAIIEKKMREVLKTWKEFEYKEVSLEEAKKLFAHNPYKLELSGEFAKEGKKLLTNNPGNFMDLCRGGHVENPSKELRYFKLLKIAGAYWRGSEKNKMLTRIYGTAFPTQKELDDYLRGLSEAEKRDHRKLGQELEIFTTSTSVGPGLILWLPNGVVLREELEKLGKETEAKYGYQRVVTPHLGKEELYLTSGHLPYYAQDMWPPMEYEGQKYYVKPMNCPHMHMIYKFKPRSYKDLPLRLAEFGTVYRHEDSGTLTGLMRVRGHTTNDAHIYCRQDQVVEELVKVIQMHTDYYKLFNITEYYIELALPDFEKKPDKFVTDSSGWEKSIALLRTAARQSKVEVSEQAGTAAFYGPKFDFNIKSVTGREFGASTNQIDFGSGSRFKLSYTDKDGSEKIVPYIIHRAPLGSEERFIGFLIEHFAGAFPVWLSPIQVKVIPVSDRSLDYAKAVNQHLQGVALRTEIDDRNERLEAKIRDAQLQKIPYMIIVGKKEVENKQIAVRLRDGRDLGQTDLVDFTRRAKDLILTKSLNLW